MHKPSQSYQFAPGGPNGPSGCGCSRRCLTWVGALVLACDPFGPVSVEPRDGPACGNGLVEDGEECDLGFANAVDGPCRADCRAPRCGDGRPDEGEQCDDGNDDDRDGCRRDCTRPLRSTWVRALDGGELAGVLHAVAPTADGGVIAVGQGQAAEGAPLRAWITEHGSDGELRWSRWLPVEDGWAAATARAVAIDGEGDLWIAGELAVDEQDDVWLVRCDPQGEPRWSFHDDYGLRDRLSALALHEGGVVVAGEVMLEPADRDGLVLAFGGEGTLRWLHRHDGPAGGIDDARALAVAPDGGVLVGGGEDDLTRWWLAKLDADGRELGVSRQRGEVGAWVAAVAVDAGGDPWIAGTEVLDAPDPSDASTWHTQPWLARLDPAGGVRWRVDEPAAGTVRREAFGLALDPRGGATVVGTDPLPQATCSRRHCPGRPWLTSYDAGGQRRWWALPDAVTQGEGRAAAWGEDGTLWIAGARRVVYLEADAWLGRYREAEEVAP